jgi:hypothetical protein
VQFQNLPKMVESLPFSTCNVQSGALSHVHCYSYRWFFTEVLHNYRHVITQSFVLGRVETLTCHVAFIHELSFTKVAIFV